MTTARHLIAWLSLTMAASILKAQPQATFPVTHHDFGIIHESDGPAQCLFPLVNTGDKPLKVLTARANCGCTTPRFSRSPLAPGDTMWIEAAYDPIGRPGKFDKKIYIDTNTSPSRTTLTITGTVIAEGATLDSRYPVHLDPVRLRTTTALVGPITPIQARGAYIEGYNAGEDTITPRAISPDPSVSIIVQPGKVPPGEQFIYSIVIGSDKKDRWGRIVAPITAYINETDTPAIELEAIFTVVEDFSHLTDKELSDAPKIVADNRTVDFGRIPVSTHTPLDATIRIGNQGKTPLKIHRVYSDDPHLSVRMKKDSVKPGKKEDINISLSPDVIPDGIINTEFHIITNDPAMSTLTVRVVGEVTNTR